MNRRSAIQTLMGWGAGSLLWRPARGCDDDDFVIRSEARLVVLEVSVKNRGGGFASGLTKENFRVFENGRPQDITVFDHNDTPVSIGILVDESRSMTPKRASVLTAALTFIGESNPDDEMFVLNFNDDVQPGLTPPLLFSGDRAELRTALFRGVSQGKTALYDAVCDGLEQLQLGKREKKTLVLISDGGDNASRHTRRQALDRIERSIATVYTVGIFDENDADRDPGILQQIARVSGGEAYFPASINEMVPVCKRIAHDIRNCYTIGYRPEARPAAGKHVRDLRSIRVDASSPSHGGLITRARTSYRYDSEAGN